MERHSSLIVPRYFSLPLVLRSTMCVPLVPQLSKKLDVDLGQGVPKLYSSILSHSDNLACSLSRGLQILESFVLRTCA